MAGYIGKGKSVVNVASYTKAQADAEFVQVAGDTMTGALTIDADGATVLTVDRATSNGTIIDVQKDGTTVGSIGVANGDNLYISSDDTNDVGVKFNGDGNRITPCDASGADRNGAIDLGESSARFKDLYLSGGVYLGGTGSANKLDDYEEGTWTPVVGVGFTSPSYSIQVGYYTKIGNIVRAYFRILLNGGTGTGSSVVFGGLPFTAANNGSEFPTGTHYINAATAGGEHSKLLVFPNANSIYLYSQDETTVTGISGATVGNSFDILGQVIYHTTA